jgi:hypothetical protein
MNERIEKLAKKTGLLGRKFMFGQYYDDELTDEQKKFAKLIVQECMEQVWYNREDSINGNVSEVIKDRIKQHFGVE